MTEKEHRALRRQIEEFQIEEFRNALSLWMTPLHAGQCRIEAEMDEPEDPPHAAPLRLTSGPDGRTW